MKLADMASVATYCESSRMFKNISGIDMSKSTIHGLFRKWASLHALTKMRLKIQLLSMMALKFNQLVRGTAPSRWPYPMSKKAVKRVSFISVTVNKDWARMPQGTFSVADAEREMENNVDPSSHQLDLVHACSDKYTVRDVDGPKEERDQIACRMKVIFHMLVNSAKKHLADEDMDALPLRIDVTLDELEMTAAELESNGYRRAARFIRGSFMVTFARVAISEGREYLTLQTQ